MTGFSCKLACVDKLHGLLNHAFREHIDGELSIRPLNFDNSRLLKVRRISGPVIFDLRSTNEVIIQAARRSGTPASPLSGFNSDSRECAWVSWREEWTKTLSSFELKSVGFTFAWGPSTNVRDTLFRAEWDQNGTEKAAHPHWHVDTLLPDSDISVSRIHFGMSGWQGDATFPKRWQSVVEKEHDIILWASRSLEYAKQQIFEYLPTSRSMT